MGNRTTSQFFWLVATVKQDAEIILAEPHRFGGIEQMSCGVISNSSPASADAAGKNDVGMLRGRIAVRHFAISVHLHDIIWKSTAEFMITFSSENFKSSRHLRSIIQRFPRCFCWRKASFFIFVGLSLFWGLCPPSNGYRSINFACAAKAAQAYRKGIQSHGGK